MHIDTEALRAKYRAETNGINQLEKHVEVLIVGGGWGGQLIAANLQKSGISDLLILEKVGNFGGVCTGIGDIPKEKYARSKELLEHAQAIGKHFGLYERSLFQTEGLRLEWDEATQRWTATTSCNDKITAKFVATPSGPLYNSKLAGIPGIGGLNKIGDKRIGIIRTGATGIQVIPHLAEGAGHLYAFQRTPSSVDHRKDGPTDPEWVKKLTPSWQRKRMENFNCNIK
ncbi:hypothetical protein ACJ73_03792 [Blastomyces percursus]|uniref:FAD/NAD(P)-binding domain-containing protein n=1 Tax=Blastomyces percursus TaxID=1658174 RepID=A0A1J9RA25_9EURO|nr:hypothetical protein ACJ73_03792 [Blastomyces percursus]